jgi:hypothetical protein
MPNLVLILKRMWGKVTQRVYNRGALEAAQDIEKRKGAQRLARPERPKLKPSIAQV